MSANCLVVTGVPPPTLIYLADGPVVVQNEDVGVHHVIDVYVVTDRLTVFVHRWGDAMLVAEAEDPAGTRVRVEGRLTRPLDNAVAQGGSGNAVPAAEVNGHHFLA